MSDKFAIAMKLLKAIVPKNSNQKNEIVSNKSVGETISSKVPGT